MNKHFLCLFLTVIQITYFSGLVFGLDDSFEKLKADYFSLRNTDLQIERVADWKHLGRRYSSWIAKHSKDSNLPHALYNSAVIEEQLFRKFRIDAALDKALGLLSRLVKDFPKHPLRPDALLKLGDLYFYELQDKQRAKEAYGQLKSQYPTSNLSRILKEREAQLEGKSFDAVTEEAVASSRSLKNRVVLIDPGHGGEDFGAVGPTGLLEKNVTLAVAKEVSRLLSKDFLVRLTRDQDSFVPLQERTNMANDYEADLFISLHVNASPRGKLQGLQTFYLDNAEDKASKQLAERENRSINLEGPQADLQYMLSDLIQSSKLGPSISLANLIQRTLVSGMKDKWQVTDLGVRKAPFYVLVGAHMPCILVEMFFIDHPLDGENLKKKNFREDLASGLAIGIKQFLSTSDVE